MPSSLAVTLSGEYATLTPLTFDDVAGLVRAATENRSTYDLTHVPDSEDGMRDVLERLFVERENRGGVPFATRDTLSGEIVGMTRFLTLRWWYGREFPDGAEIGGTFLAASAQRTAINTDAKLLMLTHAFETWGVQRVDLKTDERNVRSRAAIERLGAHFDGVLRHWQPSLASGEEGLARDSAMYSILPEEWPELRNTLARRLR